MHSIPPLSYSENLETSQLQNLQRDLQNKKSASIARMDAIRQQITALTLPYKDESGNTICLWKTETYGLVGGVLTKQGEFKIIPSHRIYNPLSSNQNHDHLIKRLEAAVAKQWIFIFNSTCEILTIWPRMIAAAKHGVIGQYDDIYKSKLNTKTISAAVREKHGEVVMCKPGTDIPYDHQTKVAQFSTGIERHIEALNKQLNNIKVPLSPEERNKVLIEKQKCERHLEYVQRGLNLNIQAYRLGVKTLRTSPNDPNSSPDKKQFHELLQKTGLTKSYNSSHAHQPAPKGSGSGEIGGVGGTVELIEGLFDSPESLFEMNHSFFIPTFLDETSVFSNDELYQILQELTRGIYIHGTLPFFSLHFNEDANLYPVIHPAYENTLVGQIFAMLDYMMKGYLNGNIFEEEFIQAWHKNPKKIDKDDLKHLINLHHYCQDNLELEDKNYISTHMLFERGTLEKIGELLEDKIGQLFDSSKKEDPIFYNFTKFSNSFRIIAKQKEINKAEDLFILNSDFEVAYTIKPDPDYLQALEHHLKLNGTHPKGYLHLLEVYELMKTQIHDHMVKLPFCRKYFALLGVINFFSHYLMTLKEHRKIPLIPIPKNRKAQCPALFPALPIFKHKEEKLIFDALKIKKIIFNEQMTFLKNYLSNLANETQIEEFNQACVDYLRKEICENASDYMKQEVNNKKVDTIFEMVFKEFKFLESLKAEFISYQNRYKQLPQNQIVDVFLNILSSKISAHPSSSNEKQELPFSLAMPILSHEQTDAEREQTKKIVGGCGMVISPKKIQLHPNGPAYLNHIWPLLENVKFGESVVSSNTDSSCLPGLAFKLNFIDLPLDYHENHADIELFLSTSDEMITTILDMQILMQSIQKGDIKEFTKKADQIDLIALMDYHGRSLLHYSVQSEDISFTKFLLEKGLSVKHCDTKFYTPLHYAAMHGRIEQLDILMATDKSLINLQSNQGATALMVAIQHQQTETIEHLLKKGAKVDTRLKDGYTALHCAVHQGHIKIVEKLLLNSNAFINQKTNEGLTPLMIACQHDSVDLVKLLLKYQATANEKMKDGTTTLEVAVKKDNFDLCQLLLPHCKLNATTIEIAIKKSCLKINQILSKDPTYLTYTNNINDTPLLMAIRYANIPVAEHILSLLDHPTHILHVNLLDETPLELAIKGKLYFFVEKLIQKTMPIAPFKFSKLLLKNGYECGSDFLNQQILVKNSTEKFALMKVALEAGNYIGLTYLFKKFGQDSFSVEGPKKWRMEHYLAKADGIFQFKKHYFKNKDCLQSRDEEDKSVAYIAAENGSSRILNFILNHSLEKPHLLQKHHKNRHLFFAILIQSEIEKISEFVEKFEKYNLLNCPLDSDNTYATHLAAKKCPQHVISYLYKKSANFDVYDKYGHTPFFYVIQRREEKLIDFFINHMPKYLLKADALYLAATYKEDKWLNLILKNAGLLDAYSINVLNQALLLAILHHDSNVSIRLIEKGASLNYKNSEGLTPLLLASKNGQVELVSYILSKHADSTQEEIEGNSALHLACLYGHLECTKLLLKHGFSENACNHKGETAKSLATCLAVKAHFQIQPDCIIYSDLMVKLQQIIADPNSFHLLSSLKDWSPNHFFSVKISGQFYHGTLLHFLLRFCKTIKNFENIIKKIINQKSFDPLLKDSKNTSYGHLMINQKIDPTKYAKIDLNSIDCQGKSLLHLAACIKDDNLLSNLLEKWEPINIDVTDKKGRTPLFYAIKSRHLASVELLIKKGANLNLHTHQGVTPLIFAILMDHYPMIRTLVQHGANINLSDFNGINPLIYALRSKQDDIPLFFLFNGAKLNKFNSSEGSLAHIAAGLDKSYVLRLLTEQGNLLSSVDKDGLQPIHEAAKKGKVQTLKYLSSQGISLNTPVEQSENELQLSGNIVNATPLLLACANANGKTINWLLSQRVDVTAKTDANMNILQFVLRNSPGNRAELLNIFKNYYLTQDLEQVLPAIASAAAQNDVKSLEFLYHLGLPFHATYQGMNGLHYACMFGSLHATEFFLKKGLDTEILTEQGQKAIEFAAQNSSVEQFKLMLNSNPCSLDQKNLIGESLLHLAVSAGKISHVMELIDRKANFEIQDSQGQTPLHIAAKKGFKELISLLMITGADRNAKTFFNLLTPADCAASEIKIFMKKIDESFLTANSGSTPLHIAVKNDDTLSLLLNLRHYPVDCKDSEGRTALHLAVERGLMKNIRLLLGNHADINMQDESGKTPLSIACIEKPNPLVMQFLLTCGAKVKHERCKRRQRQIKDYCALKGEK